MKILMVMFPMSLEGGIKTHAIQLRKGLEENGANVKIGYCTKTGRGKSEIADFHFSWQDTKISAYKNYVKDVDAVIFESTCPHITKAFTDTGWQKLFDTGKTNLVVFHDPYAEKYYPWIKDVKDKIHHSIYGGEMMKHSSDIAGCESSHFIPSPIDTTRKNIDLSEKENFSLMPHQWKSWKRHYDVLLSIEQQKYPVVATHCGINRRKWASNMSAFKEKRIIWDKAINSGMFQYKGIVPYAEVVDLFEKAKVVIDISKPGVGAGKKRVFFSLVNISTLEGMMNGCSPVVSENIANFPNFPRENSYVINEKDTVDSIPKMCASAIENYCDDLKKLEANIKWVEENFNRKKIARQFLDVLDQKEPIKTPIQKDSDSWFNL